MSIITELSLSQLKSHRRRSAVICTAAILTLVLFMTIMSITFALAESFQLSLMLAAGSRSHASIETGNYSLSRTELLEKVQAYPSVKNTFFVTSYGAYTDESDDNKNKSLYGFSSKSMLSETFIELVGGRFPENRNEVVLNREIYPDIKLGDSVTFGFTHYSYDTGKIEKSDINFTVVGLSKGYTDRQLSAFTIVDESLVNELASIVQLFINFKSSINISEKVDALTESLTEYVIVDQLNIFVNSAYIGANATEFLNPLSITLIVIVVSVIFFAAFLLIYNIYSIALTQDMQQLGLLSVVGTTYKQMKKLTLCQTLILFIISLPIGILLGYLIGWKLLTPIFMSMSGEILPFTFNWWIPVVSIILTLFTLCFSAARPLRRLRAYTPIQTVNAEPNTITSRKVSSKSEGNSTPISLAAASVKREPKKLAVTSLSAALSILLFIVVSTLADTVSNVMTIDIMISDISVNLRKVSKFGANDLNNELSIDEKLYDDIAALDGIESIGCVRYAIASVKGTSEISQRARKFRDTYPFEEEQLNKLVDGNPDAIFIGVSDELCKHIEVDRNEYGNSIFYTGSELYDGNHILFISERLARANHDSTTFGEPFDFFYLNDGDLLYSDSLSKSYTVINGYSSYSRELYALGAIFYYSDYYPVFILPLSEFEKQFPDSKLASILINSVEENDKSLANEIERLCESSPSFTIESNIYGEEYETYAPTAHYRFDDMAELNARTNAIRVTGYGLAAIVFLIGILNMINSALTSVMQKRREYAMLEAVGMTGNQLNLMIICENSVSSIISAIVLLISTPLIRIMMDRVFKTEVSINPLSATIMLILTFAAAIVTSLISYKMLIRSPVTERLKVE
ncbi:MAG: ABC transporter permease [Clostridiales bacterium]|nr:ABC transporter permease [Clostridiales bacterium]